MFAVTITPIATTSTATSTIIIVIGGLSVSVWIRLPRPTCWNGERDWCLLLLLRRRRTAHFTCGAIIDIPTRRRI